MVTWISFFCLLLNGKRNYVTCQLGLPELKGSTEGFPLIPPHKMWAKEERCDPDSGRNQREEGSREGE